MIGEVTPLGQSIVQDHIDGRRQVHATISGNVDLIPALGRKCIRQGAIFWTKQIKRTLRVLVLWQRFGIRKQINRHRNGPMRQHTEQIVHANQGDIQMTLLVVGIKRLGSVVAAPGIKHRVNPVTTRRPHYRADIFWRFRVNQSDAGKAFTFNALIKTGQLRHLIYSGAPVHFAFLRQEAGDKAVFQKRLDVIQLQLQRICDPLQIFVEVATEIRGIVGIDHGTQILLEKLFEIVLLEVIENP